MRHFADRLQAAIQDKQNPTVMGLDPMLSYVPERIVSFYQKELDDPLLATGLSIYEFNRRLIDSVCDLIPAVKPQLAYYEQYGIHGIEALRQTIAYAHKKDLLVILDGKRNDIGSTADAYARAYLGQTQWIDGSENEAMAADALTVNAYLGADGITPFLKQAKEHGKGLYILVRTSNPSAGDLQDLKLEDGRTVYEAMAGLVSDWGKDLIGESGYAAAGAVVGATWPQQAETLRRLMPHTPILVPGYGAQGATADDTMPNFDEQGNGAIVNASRSLMCAWKKHGMDQDQFDLAARKEAMAMKQALSEALRKSGRWQ